MLGFCNWLAVALPLVTIPARAEDKLIGTKAPEWQVTDWINSKPLTLKDLAGKVVLIRWWTAPGCPFCAATAPALNEFHTQFKERGLVIIGYYHHKADTPLKLEDVKRSAEAFGFKFPIAVDPEWQTLRRWWLEKNERAWTSVSFLIDRKGVIRHVHPGGTYIKGDKAYEAMKSKIEELLREGESGAIDRATLERRRVRQWLTHFSKP